MNEFYAGCRYLCDLRPAVYQMATLRLWTFEQLAEALADEAQREDTP